MPVHLLTKATRTELIKTMVLEMTKVRKVCIQNNIKGLIKHGSVDFLSTKHSSCEPGDHSWSKTIHDACSSLKNKSIIAVPTDTVYGIAGLAQCTDAVSQIYKIKGRDGGKPVSICVGSVNEINKWGNVTVDNSLLHELLPGPVTVVLERTQLLNPELNPGTRLIGIRVPDHDFIRRLVECCEEPLALTSANVSNSPSTLSTEEFSHLWPALDMVVDGGVLGDTELSRCGSTVVDLSHSGMYKIIRPGSALLNTKTILDKHGLKELNNMDIDT